MHCLQTLRTYRSVTSKSDSGSGFEASGSFFENFTLQWPWTGAGSCRPPPGLAAVPGWHLASWQPKPHLEREFQVTVTWCEVLLTWGERQSVVLKGDLCIGEDQPGSLCTTADVKVADLHRGSGEAVTASTVLNQLTGSLSFAASNGLLLRSLPIGALWNSFSLLKNGSLKRFNKA